MIENRILWRKARGEKALGVSMNEPSEELVELAGRMGLDFVSLDGQHAPVTPQQVGTVCRIAEGFGMTTTMRIQDGAESTILSYLDRGVQVIVVPNLQTRAEAEALVKHTFFAPLGLRSSTSYPMVMRQEGPDRIGLFQAANRNTLVVPQLESVTSVENLDDILQVDGIDFFAGGPEDMAQSLGIPGGHADPRVAEQFDRAAAKVKAAGKHMLGDHTESVQARDVLKGALEEALGSLGRKSALAW